MATKPLLILFLSTGNAARSILAEALLNSKGSERFVARSAGCDPAEKVDRETLAMLRSHHFETDSLHTKNWSFFQKAPPSLLPDVVISLSEEARTICTPWPHSPVQAHWIVDDPLSAARADVREWKFRKCFAVLETRIAALVRARPAPSSIELFLQLKDIGMVV